MEDPKRYNTLVVDLGCSHTSSAQQLLKYGDSKQQILRVHCHLRNLDLNISFYCNVLPFISPKKLETIYNFPYVSTFLNSWSRILKSNVREIYSNFISELLYSCGSCRSKLQCELHAINFFLVQGEWILQICWNNRLLEIIVKNCAATKHSLSITIEIETCWLYTVKDRRTGCFIF